MARQAQFKHKLFFFVCLCPLASSLLCIVYQLYASIKPPHPQKYYLNIKSNILLAPTRQLLKR